MSEKFGVSFNVLNLGGGIGVPYTIYDRKVEVASVIRGMAEALKAVCRERDTELPRVILEPGRSSPTRA